MKEDLQIEQAARLADTKAPEKLSTARAGDFIGDTMRKERRRVPAFAWGGAAFAFAVAAAVAVVLIVPTGRSSSPAAVMQEMQSVHASSEVADSAAVSPADTLDSFELPTVAE